MNSYVTKAEFEQLRGDIRELRAASLNRWEFWIAVLAILLTMFYGTWQSSQTAAQTGFTAAQIMDGAADRAAERAYDRMVTQMERRDAEKQRSGH